jgi:glutathione S-transferase
MDLEQASRSPVNWPPARTARQFTSLFLMLDLYFSPTPNGLKIKLFLEETGLPYRIVAVSLSNGEQFKPGFLAISPNNKIPAIVDHEPAGGGEPLPIFESAAILAVRTTNC